MAGKGKLQQSADRRLIRDGFASVTPDTWGRLAAGVIGLVFVALAALVSATRGDTTVSRLLEAAALIGFAVFLFALGAWIWTGPIMAPWRKDREHRRLMAPIKAKQAATRPIFEERFTGWPEFSRQTALMLTIIAAEEDRVQGLGRDDTPGWPEFLLAADAAHVAAGSLWEGWRQAAIEATAPAAKLREPIDYRVAHEATAGLRRFLQERGRGLQELSHEAGIDVQDYVRRLRGDPSTVSKDPF